MKDRCKINLYNMDCMEFMKDKPDNYYDLAIVDPPYGINIKEPVIINKNKTWKNSRKTHKYKVKDWDKEKPSKKYFNELFRISKNQIIWGGNYFCLLSNNGWIIWDKKTSNELFSPFEMAWTSFKKPKIFRFMYEGYKREKGCYGEIKIHPTQKPIKLYKWLLSNYAKTGDKILDTHGGSMSIAIACWNLKFDLDLCELDKDYFTAGKKRFEKHKSQLLIF